MSRLLATSIAALSLGCTPLKNPQMSNGGKLSEVNLNLPDKKMFSDDAAKQAQIDSYDLSIKSVSEDPSCQFVSGVRAWETKKIDVKVNNSCDYKVILLVGQKVTTQATADAAAQLTIKSIYRGETDLTKIMMQESRDKGQSSVGIAVKLDLTEEGVKIGGFKGTTTTPITDTDVGIDVQVNGGGQASNSNNNSLINFSETRTAMIKLLDMGPLNIADFGGSRAKLADPQSFDDFSNNPATPSPLGDILTRAKTVLNAMVADKKASAGSCGTISVIGIVAQRNLDYNKPTNPIVVTRLKDMVKYSELIRYRTFPCGTQTTP